MEAVMPLTIIGDGEGVPNACGGIVIVLLGRTRPAGPSETGVPRIVATWPDESVWLPKTTPPGIKEAVSPPLSVGGFVTGLLLGRRDMVEVPKMIALEPSET